MIGRPGSSVPAPQYRRLLARAVVASAAVLAAAVHAAAPQQGARAPLRFEVGFATAARPSSAWARRAGATRLGDL